MVCRKQWMNMGEQYNYCLYHGFNDESVFWISLTLAWILLYCSPYEYLAYS